MGLYTSYSINFQLYQLPLILCLIIEEVIVSVKSDAIKTDLSAGEHNLGVQTQQKVQKRFKFYAYRTGTFR